jgi:hypothetical protein
MRRIVAICLGTVLLVGCAGSKGLVHTHEPGEPQDTYEPQDFETEMPGG